MQKITNIEIKNFKSIRHAEIKDCRRVNVFIGYPNVGKSNILEALSLFAVNESTSFTDLIRVKEDPTIFFNGFIEAPLMVSLNNNYEIIGEYADDLFFLKYKTNELDRGNKIQNSSASIFKELSFSNFKYIESILRSGQNERTRGLHVSNDFIIKKYDFKKDYIENNGNYSSLQYPFGNNISSIISSNELLKKETSELLRKDNLELLYDTSSQRFRILKRTDTGIFTVPYELLADTLQRLVFYKAAIYSNREKVLLFEEPESHMFPPYIRQLTTDIVFDKKDNQYFIATHSPYVLDELMEEANDDLSVYLIDYKNGETIIHHLSNENLTEIREYGVDLFFNIESYLKNGQINNA